MDITRPVCLQGRCHGKYDPGPSLGPGWISVCWVGRGRHHRWRDQHEQTSWGRKGWWVFLSVLSDVVSGQTCCCESQVRGGVRWVVGDPWRFYLRKTPNNTVLDKVPCRREGNCVRAWFLLVRWCLMSLTKKCKFFMRLCNWSHALVWLGWWCRQ